MPQCNEVDVLINTRRGSTLPNSVATEGDVKVSPDWFHSWPIVTIGHPATSASICIVDNSDIHDFRQEVASIPGVCALLVETAADGERHVTTFVLELSEEIETRVYRAEARIIDKYLDRMFDFHLRVVPRDERGRPQLPGGPFYLLTWQAI